MVPVHKEVDVLLKYSLDGNVEKSMNEPKLEPKAAVGLLRIYVKLPQALNWNIDAITDKWHLQTEMKHQYLWFSRWQPSQSSLKVTQSFQRALENMEKINK